MCFIPQENFSYGTFASNRSGAVRKLDLPPKFATELHASSPHPNLHSHAVPVSISPTSEQQQQPPCSSMAVYPSPGPQFVLPTQLPAMASPSSLHVNSNADPIFSFQSSSVSISPSQPYGMGTKNNNSHLLQTTTSVDQDNSHTNRSNSALHSNSDNGKFEESKEWLRNLRSLFSNDDIL